jgi:Zn finger protein HypA/HybF involved in hydrogenase expression
MSHLNFDYCCKKCWHTWKIPYKVLSCPKCGSKDIDLQYDVSL